MLDEVFFTERLDTIMRKLIYHIIRWNLTNMEYLVKNICSACLIFFVTCIAVKKGAFESYSETKACLFALLMCNVWSGTFNSIALFFSESEYMIDDLKKFLSVRTYVFANLIIQAFLCLIEALVCTVLLVLVYKIKNSGLVFSNIYLDYFVTFYLVLLSADMLGFCVGMLIKNIGSAMSVIPLILIVQFLFSGCLFDLEGLMSKVAIVTSAKWGFAALGAITNLNSYLPEGMELSLFEQTSSYVVQCWQQLGIITAICFIGAAAILYFRMNQYNQ